MKYLFLLVILLSGCKCAELDTCLNSCDRAQWRCQDMRHPEKNIKCTEVHLKCVKSCQNMVYGNQPIVKERLLEPEEE